MQFKAIFFEKTDAKHTVEKRILRTFSSNPDGVTLNLYKGTKYPSNKPIRKIR